jgi:hypothetical protein
LNRKENPPNKGVHTTNTTNDFEIGSDFAKRTSKSAFDALTSKLYRKTFADFT